MFLVTVVTMTGEQGVKVVEIDKPHTAIPIHYNDFSVFLSGLDDFKKAAGASTTTTKFVYLAHGETYVFKPDAVDHPGGVADHPTVCRERLQRAMVRLGGYRCRVRRW